MVTARQCLAMISQRKLTMRMSSDDGAFVQPIPLRDAPYQELQVARADVGYKGKARATWSQAPSLVVVQHIEGLTGWNTRFCDQQEGSTQCLLGKHFRRGFAFFWSGPFVDVIHRIPCTLGCHMCQGVPPTPPSSPSSTFTGWCWDGAEVVSNKLGHPHNSVDLWTLNIFNAILRAIPPLLSPVVVSAELICTASLKHAADHNCGPRNVVTWVSYCTGCCGRWILDAHDLRTINSWLLLWGLMEAGETRVKYECKCSPASALSLGRTHRDAL